MRRGNVHQADVRVLQQGFVGAIGTFDAEALGEGLRFFQAARADGQALHVVHAVQGAGGLFCNVAGPDNSDIHHVQMY